MDGKKGTIGGGSSNSDSWENIKLRGNWWEQLKAASHRYLLFPWKVAIAGANQPSESIGQALQGPEGGRGLLAASAKV